MAVTLTSGTHFPIQCMLEVYKTAGDLCAQLQAASQHIFLRTLWPNPTTRKGTFFHHCSKKLACKITYEGLFGSEEIQRNYGGIQSYGNVLHFGVWNEGNFNSKTKESFLPPFISRKTKHLVQTNGFTKTETAREEKQKIMLLPAFFLCYGFLSSKPIF